MDYGYQLLRHVVQQVFGNLGQAAQLTIAPIIVAVLVAGLLMFVGILAGEIGSLLIVLAVAVVALMYCWAAVGWHRYVLTEETGDGVFPPWNWPRVRTYLGRSILVVLVIVLVMMAALLVLSLVFATTGSGMAVFLGFGVTLLASWLATRIGLILPAAALGKPMTIGQSWSTTRPVASHVLLPIVVFSLVFAVLTQFNVMLFPAAPDSPFYLQLGEQPPLGPAGWIVAMVLAWVQFLTNLALMTTLYGNLIEGRQLN